MLTQYDPLITLSRFLGARSSSIGSIAFGEVKSIATAATGRVGKIRLAGASVDQLVEGMSWTGCPGD